MLSDENSNPKELQAGKFRWLNRFIYKGVGNLHADLNAAEKAMLVDQLATALKRYEILALSMASIRQELYRIYTEAILDKRATSQFSRDFNMSVKGLNKQIGKQIDKAFKTAFEHEREGKTLEAASTLQFAGLNNKILFNKRIKSIIKTSKTAASRELMRIEQYREKLLLSVMKMVVGIAKAHNERLDGGIIEWSDLVQDGMIAAINAVEAYHPVADGKTFTSYVYTFVNGVINKRINEATRTVSIPRTTLDRFTYVQQAMDALGIITSDILGGIWVDGKLINGKIDDETLDELVVKANELRSPNKTKFTPKEVESLLILSQEELSLDQEIGRFKSSNGPMTLTEVLEEEGPCFEERLDGKYLGPRLMQIIRNFSDDEEYTIMELRYGFGAVVGYQAVAEQYIKLTGKPMNKGKVAFIQHNVISRIQEAIKDDPEFYKTFQELFESLAFVDDVI